MGASVELTSDSVTVTGNGGRLHGTTVNMRDISDTMPTLTAIAPFADGPVRIEDVYNTRVKGCDRLEACAQNLTAMGMPVRTGRDWIAIQPVEPRPAHVACHGDHRIAMSFSIAALKTQVSLSTTQVGSERRSPNSTTPWPRCAARGRVTAPGTAAYSGGQKDTSAGAHRRQPGDMPPKPDRVAAEQAVVLVAEVGDNRAAEGGGQYLSAAVSGQPPAARRDRTRATSASLTDVRVTAPIALFISSAESRAEENASS